MKTIKHLPSNLHFEWIGLTRSCRRFSLCSIVIHCSHSQRPFLANQCPYRRHHHHHRQVIVVVVNFIIVIIVTTILPPASFQPAASLASASLAAATTAATTTVTLASKETIIIMYFAAQFKKHYWDPHVFTAQSPIHLSIARLPWCLTRRLLEQVNDETTFSMTIMVTGYVSKTTVI